MTNRARSQGAPDGAGKDAPASDAPKRIDAALAQFGSQIHALRKTMRVTQQTVEARSGLTQSGLSKIENGDGNISLRSLLQIAQGLRVKPSFLASLLDGCSDSGAVTISATSSGITVVSDVGAGPEDVKNLTRELESGRAATGKPRSKLSRR